MARPESITTEQVERCAALYAAGGSLDALAEEYGVKPVTLRARIRRRYGALPRRLPPAADPSALLRAAAVLDSIAETAPCAEMAYLARECRTAAEAARQTSEQLVAIATGADADAPKDK